MKTMNLQQLARLTRVAPRTIRYYIARGLVPGPVGAGPRAHYTSEHVERIEQVRQLQRQGLTLTEIRQRLEGKPSVSSLPEAVRWCQFMVGSDVMVMVREGIAPWRLHRVRELIGQLEALFSAVESQQAVERSDQERDQHDHNGQSICTGGHENR